MVSLFSKFFIKENMNDSELRSAYGILCGICGIILNLIVAGGKILAGTLSGSIAITADGMNNVSDAGSSIVTLLGFKISSKKADIKHPYGFGRVEYMAGLCVSAIILAMSFSLIKESIEKILHPEDTEFSILIVSILIVSILVKCYMAFYNHKVGKKINSATILATSVDSLTDCISTFVVLICTFANHFLGWKIDGYCGFLVALFVGFAGFSALRDTLNPLLGQPPSKELVDRIEEITMNYDEHILGMHDLLVHDYGPGRTFITLHAEVPAHDDVLELHEIIDALEMELTTRLNCLATVHLDPIVINDEKINKLREDVSNIVKSFDTQLSIHDFRVVPGEKRTNVLFDVVIPMSYKYESEEVAALLNDKIREELGKQYFCIIQVDNDMGTI